MTETVRGLKSALAYTRLYRDQAFVVKLGGDFDGDGYGDLVFGGLGAIHRDRQVAHLVSLTALQYAVVGLLDVLLVVFVVDVAGDNSAYAGLLAAAIGLGSTFGGLGSVVLAGRPNAGKSSLSLPSP